MLRSKAGLHAWQLLYPRLHPRHWQLHWQAGLQAGAGGHSFKIDDWHDVAYEHKSPELRNTKYTYICMYIYIYVFICVCTYHIDIYSLIYVLYMYGIGLNHTKQCIEGDAELHQ